VQDYVEKSTILDVLDNYDANITEELVIKINRVEYSILGRRAN